MKVPVADFKAKLYPFMMGIADTMPTSLHKWIGGAMIASSAGKLAGLLDGFVDSDGMVDLDAVRNLVESGFKASGGELVIPFGSDLLASFGVRPVNVKLTQADATRFLSQFSP